MTADKTSTATPRERDDSIEGPSSPLQQSPQKQQLEIMGLFADIASSLISEIPIVGDGLSNVVDTVADNRATKRRKLNGGSRRGPTSNSRAFGDGTTEPKADDFAAGFEGQGEPNNAPSFGGAGSFEAAPAHQGCGCCEKKKKLTCEERCAKKQEAKNVRDSEDCKWMKTCLGPTIRWAAKRPYRRRSYKPRSSTYRRWYGRFFKRPYSYRRGCR